VLFSPSLRRRSSLAKIDMGESERVTSVQLSQLQPVTTTPR